MSALDNFDPNKLTKQEYLWATYIPGRNPGFKMHAKENLAKSAISYHKSSAILYLWNSDTRLWEEIFRLEGDFDVCKHGGSLVTHPWQTHRKYHQHIKWFGRGKKSKLIAVCSSCKSGATLPF